MIRYDQNERIDVHPMILSIDQPFDHEQKRSLINGLNTDEIISLFDSIGHFTVQTRILIRDGDVRKNLADGSVFTDGNDRIVHQWLDERHGRLWTIVILIQDVNVDGHKTGERIFAKIANLNDQTIRLFGFVVQGTDES